MPAVLGDRAMTALTRIQATLRLDYAGVDFGLRPTARCCCSRPMRRWPIPPEADPVWNYRRPAISSALAAARRLLPYETGLHHERRRIAEGDDAASGRPNRGGGALYRSILDRDPNHAGSLHLLGLITVEQVDPNAGISFIGAGDGVSNPVLPPTITALGTRTAASAAPRMRWALTAPRLTSRPELAEIHNNLATTLRDLGRDQEAVAHYRQARTLRRRWRTSGTTSPTRSPPPTRLTRRKRATATPSA